MKNTLPDEIDRLRSNYLALLEIAPEMVLLVGADGSIEYTNHTSSVFINHLMARDGLEKVKLQIAKIIKAGSGPDNRSNPSIGMLSDLYFECRTAPFAGYRGDKLHWLVLKSPIKQKIEPNLENAFRESKINFVGSSREVQNLHSIIKKVACTDTTVLISGESGTGKELVAQLLMENSPRKDRPFLTINCNTISDLLLESELFGYEKGAFTGADKQRKGKFEIADGGSIFLDEIGDISPRMQAAMLRVLQHGEFTRVGGHRPIGVDVRIIAATNRNLAESVQNKSFRLDLFYRLNIINISLPPLRQRKEDLPELASHFIQLFSKLFNKSIDTNPQRIIKKLEKYNWPGNVRELENVIHRAVLMCNRKSLSNRDISFDMESIKFENDDKPALSPAFSGDEPLKDIIEKIEQEVISKTLETDRGNVARTASSLKISKAALYEKMKRYGIKAKSFR